MCEASGECSGHTPCAARSAVARARSRPPPSPPQHAAAPAAVAAAMNAPLRRRMAFSSGCGETTQPHEAERNRMSKACRAAAGDSARTTCVHSAAASSNTLLYLWFCPWLACLATSPVHPKAAAVGPPFSPLRYLIAAPPSLWVELSPLPSVPVFPTGFRMEIAASLYFSCGDKPPHTPGVSAAAPLPLRATGPDSGTGWQPLKRTGGTDPPAIRVQCDGGAAPAQSRRMSCPSQIRSPVACSSRPAPALRQATDAARALEITPDRRSGRTAAARLSRALRKCESAAAGVREEVQTSDRASLAPSRTAGVTCPTAAPR